MGAASSSAISRNSNENQSEISFATLALSNKSTASRAIYTKLSNIPSVYGLCQREVDAVKRGPKLNLIKNFGKGGGGGGGVTLQL